MGNLVDLATGAVQSIGRYFGIVSVIPSALLVAFGYLLIAGGAWYGPPNWSRAIDELVHPGVGGVGVLTLVSLGVALALHPMQFAIVQFFEGYWGNWEPAQRLRIQRILRYRRLHDQIERRQIEAETLAETFQPGAIGGLMPQAEAAEARATLNSISDEASRLLDSSLPRDDRDVMPTRLGNAMRRFERLAGQQYGLDAPAVFPHLMLVSPPDHVGYVNDQRSQLDLAIRLSFTALTACGMAVIFLCRDGAWLLVALIPYVIAYGSYRGAVVLARQYATAVNTVTDLNRFALYERMGVQRPVSSSAERLANAGLLTLLDHSEHVDIPYAAFDGNDPPAGLPGTSPG